MSDGTVTVSFGADLAGHASAVASKEAASASEGEIKITSEMIEAGSEAAQSFFTWELSDPGSLALSVVSAALAAAGIRAVPCE